MPSWQNSYYPRRVGVISVQEVLPPSCQKPDARTWKEAQQAPWHPVCLLDPAASFQAILCKRKENPCPLLTSFPVWPCCLPGAPSQLLPGATKRLLPPTPAASCPLPQQCHCFLPLTTPSLWALSASGVWENAAGSEQSRTTAIQTPGRGGRARPFLHSPGQPGTPGQKDGMGQPQDGPEHDQEQ